MVRKQKTAVLFSAALTMVMALAQRGAGATSSEAPASDSVVPANTWVDVAEAAPAGAAARLVYLPEQKALWLWGQGASLVFDVAGRKWAAQGQPPVVQERGTWYGIWKGDKPALPGYNVGCWVGGQQCYLPEEKKLLYFLGGLTFKLDPARDGAKPFENMDIPFAKAPPDTILGAMAWDPQHKEVILFGGGQIGASHGCGDSMYERRTDLGAWTPERWDTRGTWAYDPAKNAWRKLETASKEIGDANARLGEFIKSVHQHWGQTRRIALQYADMVPGRSAIEIARAVEALAAEIAAFSKGIAGKGASDYEKGQFAAAAAILDKEVAAGLKETAAALAAADGWRAFRALDGVEVCLDDAREAMACAPRPRHHANIVYDPGTRTMVLWGGDGGDRFLADTWLLHLDTGRWERLRLEVHPPTAESRPPAMDFDSDLKLIVLAHPDGSAWTFDAGKREWKHYAVDGKIGNKGALYAWSSLTYVPESRIHVISNAGTSYGKTGAQRLQMLRLDLAAAKPLDAKAGVPTEVWRPGYGSGGGGPADRYHLAWSFLPKTQTEYRDKVTEHTKRLAAIPDNTWTEIKSPYASWGRGWGSFAYDPDREEIHIYGGGHSAYQGNEWSQYDLKSGLWMESWNPEFPPDPNGSPDGPMWGPPFYSTITGPNHGYHHFGYWRAVKKVLYPNIPAYYDPDLMRYSETPVRLMKEANRQIPGNVVDMSGDSRLFIASGAHWWGGPFGVWVGDEQSNTLARTKGSEPPFGLNSESHAVFDTRRNRLIYYGTPAAKTKQNNGMYVCSPDALKWEKIEPKVEPEGAEPPVTGWWNYCYSAKYDILLLCGKDATWVYSCEKNVWKKLGCAPQETNAGVTYSPKLDLFFMLENNGYRPQRVFVFRYKP
jgi:hypothetical protein